MKSNNKSSIIRYIYLILLGALSLTVLYIVSKGNNFLIDKDSYQFLIGLESQIVFEGKLGQLGDNISFPLYNRVGYGVLTYLVSLMLSESNQAVNVLAFINFVAILVSGYLIYSIASILKANQKLAIAGAVLFLFVPSQIFFSKALLNDSISIALLLALCYSFFKTRQFTWGKTALAVLISLFRIEYLIVLVPFLFILEGKKSTNILKMIGTLMCSLLINFLLVYVLNQGNFLEYTKEVLAILKPELIYFLLIGVLLGGMMLKANLQMLMWFGLVAFVGVGIYLLDTEGVNFAKIYFQNYSQFIILFVITLVISLKQKVSNEAKVLLIICILLFGVYKSLYTQHTTVYIPFVLLFSVLIFSQTKFFTKRHSNFLLMGVVAVAVLASIWNYNNIFQRYDKDLAQIAIRKMDSFYQLQGKEIVYSPFPEAVFFLKETNSRDLKKLNLEESSVDRIIIITFKHEQYISRYYDVIEERQFALGLNYQISQEGVGNNPEYLYIYVLNKKS